MVDVVWFTPIRHLFHYLFFLNFQIFQVYTQRLFDADIFLLPPQNKINK